MAGRHRATRGISRWASLAAVVVVIGVGLITTVVPRDTPPSTNAATVSGIVDTPTADYTASLGGGGDGLLTPPPVVRTTTAEPPPLPVVVPPPADPVPTNTPFSPPPPPLPNPGNTGAGWQAMWTVIHARFPDATLASAYRTSNCGQYHCIGLAIDISGSASLMREIDAWIAATYPDTAQLIHAPGPFNLLNGLPFDYGQATLSEHYDHVHWAYEGNV